MNDQDKLEYGLYLLAKTCQAHNVPLTITEDKNIVIGNNITGIIVSFEQLTKETIEQCFEAITESTLKQLSEYGQQLLR